MKSESSNKTLLFFLLLAAAMFLPAYFINLDMVQLIRDEAIRAVVAFEMLKSGDFITPTISGEPYLNKPPLFNWILAFFFFVTGSYSELVMRLPVILSIILFSITIFFSTRKELGNRFAMINALAFATYGRIIFYESLHGLIDVTFSWLTYSFFMLSWYFFRTRKFLSLFLVAYAITAISFLLKGLPSLYFTAITLLVLFIQGKQFRMLLNWRHVLGIFLMLLVLGTYYYFYFTGNHIEPSRIFEVLTGEVTRRTVVHFGIWATLLHLVTYPFENIYHFFPWSILVILLLRKESFGYIRRNPFLWFNILVFTFNIIPYWTSPEAYARYILMLVPLFMTVLFALYKYYNEKGDRIYMWVDYLFGILISVIGLVGIILVINPATRDLPYIIAVSAGSLVLMATISLFYWRQPANRLLWVVIAVLVVRIAFNFSIIPSWEKTHPVVPTRELITELAAETSGKPLYIYWNPQFKPDPYFQFRYNNEIFTFYLSVARQEMIRVRQEQIPGAFFIAQKEHLRDTDYELIKIIEPAWQVPVYLVEFNRVSNPEVSNPIK